MITLTPGDGKFRVDYFMESKENTRWALAIGQIQTKIREKSCLRFSVNWITLQEKNLRRKHP